MTDEQAMDKYKAMEQYFGELPNFEHHPIQFAHCVKLYNYYKSMLDENTQVE